MKTILALGGFGFIATNILKHIDQFYMAKYQVIVFDRINKHPHNISFECVKKVYAGDFSDKKFIDSIFRENQIDIVLHALSSTVPSTSGNSQFDVLTNLIPTLDLLDTMESHAVKDIVYLSSGGAIYGDYFDKPHVEDENVFPKSSYGIVKLAIEKYLFSYVGKCGLRPLVLRVSNPFGKYHYNTKQGVVNIFIRNGLGSNPIQVWGSGEGRKDYIYVEDVCQILMKLIERGVHTEVINVASANPKSLNDIINKINKTGIDLNVERKESLQTDVQEFLLNTDKLHGYIDDLSLTPFDVALKETINWEKAQLIK